LRCSLQALKTDPLFFDLLATGERSPGVRDLRFATVFLDGVSDFITAASNLRVGTAFSVTVTAKQTIGNNGYLFAKSDSTGEARAFSLFYSSSRNEYVTLILHEGPKPCHGCVW